MSQRLSSAAPHGFTAAQPLLSSVLVLRAGPVLGGASGRGESGALAGAAGTERGRGGGPGESRADRPAGGTLSALPAAGQHRRRGLTFNRVGSGSKPSCAVALTGTHPQTVQEERDLQ